MEVCELYVAGGGGTGAEQPGVQKQLPPTLGARELFQAVAEWRLPTHLVLCRNCPRLFHAYFAL